MTAPGVRRPGRDHHPRHRSGAQRQEPARRAPALAGAGGHLRRDGTARADVAHRRPEWSRRVESHRARRPASWRTVETADVAGTIASAQGAVLVDCLGTWLTALVDAVGLARPRRRGGPRPAARVVTSSRPSVPPTSPSSSSPTRSAGRSSPRRRRDASSRTSSAVSTPSWRPRQPTCTSSSPAACSTSATPPSSLRALPLGRSGCVTPGAWPSAPSRRCRRGHRTHVDGRTHGRRDAARPGHDRPRSSSRGSPSALLTTHGLLPYAVAAVLALVAAALLSRALHLDGLADLADGLTSGHDRERSLEVMRRGDTGPAGAAALVLVLGLDAACLASPARPTRSGRPWP